MTITSFDGTKIAAHWFPGKGVSQGNPAPTASSSLYDVQRSTGPVTFNGINVTMPLGDPGHRILERQGEEPQEAPEAQTPPLASPLGLGP